MTGGLATARLMDRIDQDGWLRHALDDDVPDPDPDETPAGAGDKRWNGRPLGSEIQRRQRRMERED